MNWRSELEDNRRLSELLAQHSLDKEKQEKKKKKFSGYIFNGDGDGDGADDDGSDNDYNDGDGGGNGDSEIDNFIKDIDSGLTASDSDQDSELKGNSTLLDREQQSASLKVSKDSLSEYSEKEAGDLRTSVKESSTRKHGSSGKNSSELNSSAQAIGEEQPRNETLSKPKQGQLKGSLSSYENDDPFLVADQANRLYSTLQSANGSHEEAYNSTFSARNLVQSNKLAPLSALNAGHTVPGSIQYVFAVFIVSIGVIAITYFVRSKNRKRGRFTQASTSPQWWLFLSRIFYAAGGNSRKSMSSPLPSPRSMDEDDSGMRRGSLNNSLSSSTSSSSYSLVSGAAYVTNALNRMVRDSQFARWTVSTVRSAYRRSQPFFFQPGQTIQSSQSQRRMASSSTTSTAKEKDEFAGVTVEGGAGASGSSTGTSMTKSKLSDTQNEGRVNRKLVTTSLSSVGATMSSSKVSLPSEEVSEGGGRRKNATKAAHDTGTTSSTLASDKSKQSEGGNIESSVSRHNQIGLFPGRDRPSFSPVVTLQDDIDWLVAQLPTMQRMERWVLLYSKAEHGTSINTLYSKVDSAPKSNAKVNNLTRAFHSPSSSNLAGIGMNPSPPGSSLNLNASSTKPYMSSYPSGNFTFHGHGSVCVLLIKDTNGSVFGCYTTERWHIPATAERHSYGTGESFVFTISPNRRVYRWSQKNSVFQSSARNFFAIGGGDNFAIYVSGDMSEGVSRPCATFSSPTLSSEPEFRIQQMEVWGFQ